MNKKKVLVSFKDPDFAYELRQAGLPNSVVDRLEETAEFGEYWSIELHLDTSGKIVGGKFLKTEFSD